MIVSAAISKNLDPLLCPYEQPYRVVIDRVCQAYEKYKSNPTNEPQELENLLLMHNVAILYCTPPTWNLVEYLQKLEFLRNSSETLEFVETCNNIFGKGLHLLEEQRNQLLQLRFQNEDLVFPPSKSKFLDSPEIDVMARYHYPMEHAFSLYGRQYWESQKIKKIFDANFMAWKVERQSPRELLKGIKDRQEACSKIGHTVHEKVLRDYDYAIAYCSPPLQDLSAVMKKLEAIVNFDSIFAFKRLKKEHAEVRDFTNNAFSLSNEFYQASNAFIKHKIDEKLSYEDLINRYDSELYGTPSKSISADVPAKKPASTAAVLSDEETTQRSPRRVGWKPQLTEIHEMKGDEDTT